jgi:hypothetical protein
MGAEGRDGKREGRAFFSGNGMGVRTAKKGRRTPERFRWVHNESRGRMGRGWWRGGRRRKVAGSRWSVFGDVCWKIGV